MSVIPVKSLQFEFKSMCTGFICKDPINMPEPRRNENSTSRIGSVLSGVCYVSASTEKFNECKLFSNV